MKHVLLTILFGLLILPSFGADKPNLIFIIADDLGWGDVEFHNGNAPTPNLNRLLEQGVELRQHYVAPVCSPTRAGFLTGRYWSRFGVTAPTNTLGLPRGTATAASALREAGYETCLTGKWHLGSLPSQGPNHYGFDHSYGSLAGGVTPYSHVYKKGPYTTTWHRNEKLIKVEGHVTDLIADEAVEWIDSRGEKPFFLYAPFTAVHLPIREPEEWLQKVPAGIEGVVPRQYAASIIHLDDAVGRIVDAVERAGKTDNTLIVFTSDNGASTSENNDAKYPPDNCPDGKIPGNNEPLRGKKGDLYEGGTRVPTIVRWPGKLEAGTQFEPPVHVADWMPTFCALAESTADADKLKWDGDNIWPALTGQAELPERALYSAGTHFRSSALRQGDWKLIVFHGKKERVELFNIAEDPEEKTNLADSMAEKVTAMRQSLATESAADKDAVAAAE